MPNQVHQEQDKAHDHSCTKGNQSFVEGTLNDTAERLAGIDEIVSGYIEGIRTKISAEKDKSIVFNVVNY